MKAIKKFYFISLLRTLAVCLVIWDYLGPFWSESAGVAWKPALYVRKFLNKPLVIIQDFGFFGVALFFIISGFIITYALQRETRREFITKRFFRIFPPLICSTLIFGIVNLIIIVIFNRTTYWQQFGIKSWILDGILLNYVFNRQSVINGVTWSLIIEVIFYIVCYLLLPLLKYKSKSALTVILIINTLLTLIIYKFGVIHILINSVSYLPILAFGQIIYFYWSKKINLKEFTIFTICNYILFIFNMMKAFPHYYEEVNSYGVSLVYAYMLFIICLLLDDKISTYFESGKGKYITFISDISYSLYLNHMTFGTMILSILYQRVNYTITFLIALVIVFILSYLQHIFIEKPSMSFAKSILSKKGVNLVIVNRNESKSIKIMLIIVYLLISVIVALKYME